MSTGRDSEEAIHGYLKASRLSIDGWLVCCQLGSTQASSSLRFTPLSPSIFDYGCLDSEKILARAIPFNSQKVGIILRLRDVLN